MNSIPYLLKGPGCLDTLFTVRASRSLVTLKCPESHCFLCFAQGISQQRQSIRKCSGDVCFKIFCSAVPTAVFRSSYSSTAFDEHLHDTCIANFGDAKVEALPAGHVVLDPAVVIPTLPLPSPLSFALVLRTYETFVVRY